MQIESLGVVAHVVTPNEEHCSNVLEWKRLYPKATFWAPPGGSDHV